MDSVMLAACADELHKIAGLGQMLTTPIPGTGNLPVVSKLFSGAATAAKNIRPPVGGPSAGFKAFQASRNAVNS